MDNNTIDCVNKLTRRLAAKQAVQDDLRLLLQEVWGIINDYKCDAKDEHETFYSLYDALEKQLVLSHDKLEDKNRSDICQQT